jgi:hypothetical protein
MVNFNFGLGGLTGDDNKKDDSTTNTKDDSAIQDDQIQDQTSTSNVSSDSISTEEVKTATEPVFEEKVKTTDVEDSSPFEDSVPKEETPFEITKNPATNGDSKGLKSLNKEEEEWLKDEKTKTNDSEEKPLSDENSIIENQATEEEASPVEQSADTSSTETKESINDEVNIPTVDPEVSTTETPSKTTVDTNTEEKTNSIVPPIPERNEATSEKEPITSPPISDENLTPTPNTTLPTENKNIVAETNPFPEAAVPVETVIPAPVEPSISVTENNIPEIPTFGQPESTTIVDATEQKTEISNDNISVPTSLDNSNDLLGGEIKNNDTDSNNLFENTNKNELLIDEKVLPEEDPLAPGQIATVGGGTAPLSNHENNGKDILSLDSLEDENSAGRDQTNDDDDQNSSSSTNDPLNTLQKLKNEITKFVKDHNSKIKGYEDQIGELKKKISNEKHILKEKQQNFAKMLEDLTGLATNFSPKEEHKKHHSHKKSEKK